MSAPGEICPRRASFPFVDRDNKRRRVPGDMDRQQRREENHQMVGRPLQNEDLEFVGRKVGLRRAVVRLKVHPRDVLRRGGRGLEHGPDEASIHGGEDAGPERAGLGVPRASCGHAAVGLLSKLDAVQTPLRVVVDEEQPGGEGGGEASCEVIPHHERREIISPVCQKWRTHENNISAKIVWCFVMSPNQR